ncbi:MAG: hypothetical protein QM762_12995 [Chryseolinea sp.]
MQFADDLSTELKVWVAPDADSKSAIDAYAKQKSEEAAAQPKAPSRPDRVVTTNDRAKPRLSAGAFFLRLNTRR